QGPAAAGDGRALPGRAPGRWRGGGREREGAAVRVRVGLRIASREVTWRHFMGVSSSALFLCTNGTGCSCRCSVSFVALLWVWFGLKRSHNYCLVWAARCCFPIISAVC
uniref:Uncharacterized protein n=1 Tax=Triticum urartu TaxID=4572 RepID=A0A8R7R5P1_TRIUA